MRSFSTTPLLPSDLPTKTRSVAILRADHIGDLVLTTSLAQSLHEGGWNVDVVASPAVALLDHCKFVRNTAVIQDICPNWPKDWPKLAAWLRSRGYSATIVPFCRPVQLLWASSRSGSRQRIAMGTSLKARFFARLARHQFFPTHFNHRPRPYYEIIGDCAAPLVSNPAPRLPKLNPTAQEKSTAREHLAIKLAGKTLVGIHPSSLGHTCNLPLGEYEKLLVLILSSTTWSVIVTGSSEDQPGLENWHRHALAYPGRVWISAGSLKLRELTAILANLDAFIVPSTGPLHLAHAVGTRTITPFCPQAPACREIWGYPPYEETSLLPRPFPCDPSQEHRENCDFQGRLTGDDLMERLRSILKEK